jgi:hypothetical protein
MAITGSIGSMRPMKKVSASRPISVTTTDEPMRQASHTHGGNFGLGGFAAVGRLTSTAVIGYFDAEA